MSALVNAEFEALEQQVRNLGDEYISTKVKRMTTIAADSTKSTTELIRLRRENVRLTKENETLKQLVETTITSDRTSNTATTTTTTTNNNNTQSLQLQITRLTSELATERAAFRPHDESTSAASNDDATRRLRTRIAKLEKRNARDHEKMRSLRSELLAQSREADHLVRQNDSYLRQSGLSTTHGGSVAREGHMAGNYLGTVTTGTEDRLEHLEHEFSELQRGGDDLMFSSISGIHQSSADDSELYATALPYDRRQSMNIDLGNSKIHVDRNGQVDLSIRSNGTRSKIMAKGRRTDTLDVGELQ